MVPDITADELVDKIKEDEDADRFTCNEWLNDIDQEIFCVWVGWWTDENYWFIVSIWFSEWCTIAVRHKTVRRKLPSTSSKASFHVQSMFNSVRKKFTLMNAIHEKLFFEVKYAAESQE